LVVDAILAVKSTSILGENKYPVKAVNVVKSTEKVLSKVNSIMDMSSKCKELANKCQPELRMLKLLVLTLTSTNLE
jgi:hypothetical protein